MTSRKINQQIVNESIKTESGDQLANDDNDESMDDLLASVDQFIDGVYRDLSITPPRRSLPANITEFRTRESLDSTTSPIANSSLSGIAGNNESTPEPYSIRRNMDAEFEEINRICENVNQNLRSIGLYMNDSLSEADGINTNLTSSPPCSSASIISLNHTSPMRSNITHTLNLQNETERRSSSPMQLLDVPVVDLSDSQAYTPEIRRQVVRHYNDDDDDDVILVSANIPSVVDLCTPGDHHYRTRSRLKPLSKSRLPRSFNFEAADASSGGPSSTKRRSTEPYISLECNNHIGSYFSDNKKTSNVESSSSSNDSGRTPFLCPVCIEPCLQRQPTSTVCGHIFCKECIEHAIGVTHKCPMCNKKISRKQTFRIYL